ncbi:manganese efflux pump MntP [Falsirhodobacter xinxiangensis]|uniref:manganese efflux pump MntP n=1 Tax=Falsirhodobacter xinxiangensis TaxID=2530049 RepID=UPI0010AAC5E9|nr:manganese efflux pump MntP family protein [Rhodobacter xinxiangensis]
MSPISIGVLAIGMSVDAMIASLGRRAAQTRPTFRRAIGTGMVFGIVEMITPLIGWFLGVVASQYIQAFDHWIAFGLLGAVGTHMAWNSLGRHPETPVDGGSATMLALIVTAIGTSLDAMAVGVSLAFLDVNILLIAAAIGAATMVMSTTGMMIGRYLGAQFGRYAEVLGGLALISLGALILHEHLTAATT